MYDDDDDDDNGVKY